MKLEIYKSIINDIQNYKGSIIGPFRKLDNILQEKYTDVSKETISSIYSHFFREKMKLSHRKHIKSKYNLYKRFTDDIARNEPVGIILRIADEIGLSPALLSRFILEVYCEHLEENKLYFEEYSRASLLSGDEFNHENLSDSESNSDESSTTPDISDSEISIPFDKEFLDLASSSSKKSSGILQDSAKQFNIKEKTDPRSLENPIKNNDITCKKKESIEVSHIPQIYKEKFQTWTLIEKSREDILYSKYSTRQSLNMSFENAGQKEDINTSTSSDFHSKLNISTSSKEISNSKNISISRLEDTIDPIKISHLLEDTTLIDDKDLSYEIYLAVLYDDQYGPNADAMKRSIGEEWEFYLKNKVEELNLPFLDEENLKSFGCDKTPDVKLEIPVAVDGYVIHWIESKALFGDWDVHNQYIEEQYKSYFNRFGPGLVIYWYGFIDGLQKDRKICIRDHLPSDITIMS